MGDDSPEKQSTGDAVVESAKNSASVDTKIDAQTTEAQVDAAKDNADAATVDQTKWELGSFVSTLTVDLEKTLVAKYGKDHPETDRILDKVKDLAKVGIWLKIKSGVNSVLGFLGFINKIKPNTISPELTAKLTDAQEKITPLAEKGDTISEQFHDIASGKIVEKMMLEAQWIDTSSLAWEKDLNVDTALTTLEQEAKKLKQEKNITTAKYKIWYAKLLQQFINSVKGDKVWEQPKIELPTNESQSDTADHSHDEDLYEDIETWAISVDTKEFIASMPIWFPIVWMKEKDITSDFWARHAPKSWASTDHKGIDIWLPVGTEIVAPADGKILSVKEQKDKNWNVTGAWKYIEVDHGWFVTRYFHLNTQDVKEGAIVKKGDKIATLWNTGNSTGPHLHYEIRDKSEIIAADKKNSGKYKAINPEDFWDFDGDGKVVAMDTYKDKTEQITQAV